MRIFKDRYICGSCALRSQDGSRCGLTGLEVDPNYDFCSKHQTSPQKCYFCGKFLIGPHFIDNDDSGVHIFCEECRKNFNTCNRCLSGRTCDFETNPSKLPKLVQQQVRQGNMVAMTTVRNPERVRITCESGCKCYDSSFGGCCRDYGTCKNFNFHY